MASRRSAISQTRSTLVHSDWLLSDAADGTEQFPHFEDGPRGFQARLKRPQLGRTFQTETSSSSRDFSNDVSFPL